MPRGTADAPTNHAPLRDAVFWFDRKTTPLPALSGAVSADVVVIGGGMMGLMCARALVTQGRQVCVVEAETCGGGASGRSSGFITPDSELELHDLVRQFGAEKARALWQFGWGGVNAIRDAIREERIDCDFQDQNALFVAATPKAGKTIAEEHAARQRLGSPSTLYSRAELPAVLGSASYFGAVGFGDTFSIDAYRCCAGLRRPLVERGVRIFEQSPVTRIQGDGIETRDGAVRAPAVAVCTDRWLPHLGLARREIYHAQTFLAISEPLTEGDVARMFPQGPRIVWDTDLVYKYFRLTGDRRLLIGGGTVLSTYARGEQHRPERVVRRLTRYVDRRFPGVRVKFEACWPGLIGISKDFAPVIGRDPRSPSVHFAGGAAGLPWAAALGRYLAGRILGEGDTHGLEAVLSVQRRFPIDAKWNRLIGTPAAFALSHGWLKFSAK